MPKQDIIVIGASTGGIEAIKSLVAELPENVPAATFLVIHIGSYGLGVLPEIIQRAGKLPAENARDWQPFFHGRIYAAPPDYHLLVDRSGYTRISRGPRENRCRPAIDPLFRSAAAAFGRRVIGVVLTGWLDDGTAGAYAIKERGGTIIVQEPSEAIAPSMPESALRHVKVDYCLPLKQIASTLVKLVEVAPMESALLPVPKMMETEVDIARGESALDSGLAEFGEPSMFACPECHGVLMQIKEGSNLRFRCHTGHGYSLDSLLADMSERTEDALWSAIRGIQESMLLMQRMEGQFREHGHEQAAAKLQAKITEADQRLAALRRATLTGEKPDEAAA